MSNDIPAIVREDPDGRTAQVCQGRGSDPVGAAVFLTPDELQEIGVDPEIAEAIELRISDGSLELIPITQKDQ